MKNCITALSILSLVSVLNCKKAENDNNQNTGKFTFDSVRINDVTKVFDSVTMKYSSKVLVFPTLKDKALLDSIYFDKKEITDFSSEQLKSFLEKEKNAYLEQIKKDEKNADIHFVQNWESLSEMNVKSIENDYLQIQYYRKIFNGGANGKYDYYYKVFDLKNNKRLQLNDITSMPKEKLSEVLKKNFDNNKKGLKFSDLTVKSISPNNNFYFDDNNLYFQYNLNIFMPGYPMGDIAVAVSWKDLNGTLNPEFKQRMKIK